jgi:glycosyltransferase involved in cell wall biosynthesis
MNPAVSVIMPVLNQEAWLGAAIDSVRSQRLTDWELLIIDDGSTDSSPAVAERYAAQDAERIRTLSTAANHRGAAAARNAAMAAARGRYISFLDADDLYLREKLAEEVRMLDSAPEAAMLYGPSLWRWQDGRRADRTDRIGIPTGIVWRPPELAWRILLDKEGDIPCTCGVLIRRDRALEVGGFEETFRLYEDQTLWAKLFLKYGVLVSPRAHSIYRQHDQSVSAQAERTGEYDRWVAHPAHLAFLDWFARQIATGQIRDAQLDRALRRAFLPYRYPRLAKLDALARRIRRRIRRRAEERRANPQPSLPPL